MPILLDSAARPAVVATAAAATRDLHLTSPPMAGADVLAVQQRLTLAGFAPGRLDGVYGAATAAAVRSFQTHHGLTADGIVGQRTRRALEAVKPADVPVAIRRKPSKIGQKALAEAARHIGVKEDPPGSNRTPFGRWFGIDGVKWCNTFVSYCFFVGAGYTICRGVQAPGVYRRGCTYVPTTEAWLRSTGMWVGRTTPLPGDLAIFDWDGGQPDHIGIVEKTLGDGAFQTIEGNTELGNDSDGGAVMRRLRYLTQVDGFGRVHANRD